MVPEEGGRPPAALRKVGLFLAIRSAAGSRSTPS